MELGMNIMPLKSTPNYSFYFPTIDKNMMMDQRISEVGMPINIFYRM
jgi:hypothetical protein